MLVRDQSKSARTGGCWYLGAWFCLVGLVPAGALADDGLAHRFALEGPDRLILGDDSDAAVRFRRPQGDYSMIVNVGELSEPRPISAKAPGQADGPAPGELLGVTYTPPESRFPQVAIIAVISAAGDEYDWIRIPLYGRASIEVHTEPRVSAHVVVGDKRFGPVRTDRSGSATIPVVVPPGVMEAVSVAVDSVGNEKQDRVPLGVPPFNRLAVACPTDGSHLLMFAVDQRGEPVAGPTPELEGEPLDLGQAVARAPGVLASELVVPAGLAAGAQVTQRVWIRGESAAHGSCGMSVPLEMPLELRLQASSESYGAGSGARVDLTATLAYPGRRAPTPVEVAFEVDIGTVQVQQPGPAGRIAASWILPDTFEGQKVARARVRTRGRPALSAEKTVRLIAGPLARLDVSTPTASLPADGESTAQISVHLYDAFDNLVEPAQFEAAGHSLVASSQGGELGPLLERRGTFGMSYKAPVQLRHRRDRIRLVDPASGTEGHVAIALRSSGSPLRLNVRGGYVHNFGKVSGALLMVGGGFVPPLGAGRLQVGVELGVYYSSRSEKLALSTATPTAQLSDTGLQTRAVGFPLLARVSYYVLLEGVGLYPLLGAGAMWLDAELAGQLSGTIRVRGPVPALLAGAGATQVLGPGELVLEAGFLYAPVHEPSLTGNLGGLLGSLGYSFRL